jgi:hypothetical protein
MAQASLYKTHVVDAQKAVRGEGVLS